MRTVKLQFRYPDGKIIEKDVTPETAAEFFSDWATMDREGKMRAAGYQLYEINSPQGEETAMDGRWGDE